MTIDVFIINTPIVQWILGYEIHYICFTSI